MSAIDMTGIYSNRNYKGKWVAIMDSETKPKVIAYAKTLHAVLKKAKEKGFDMPLVTQIPKKLLPIVGPFAYTE